MTDVSEFPSTTSQDFGFKSIGNSIKLVSDFQEYIPYKHFNNFSYAPHTGLIAAAGKNDIVLGTLKGLVHDVTSQAQEYTTDSHTLEIANVNNIVFTSDEKHIALSVGNSVSSASVHEQNYKELQPQDFQSVEFTNQIDLVIPSPNNGQILAILDTAGDLFLTELSSNTIKHDAPLAQSVLSFSWSPKGKQIVITKADGAIQQIDLKGTIKATLDGSQYISEENLLPLSISWLSTFKFFVVFGEEQHPLENDDDIASYDFKTLIITHNKDSKDDYSENFDAIPSFGTLMRKPTLYTNTFHDLSSSLPLLSLFASSTSTDVSAITDHELLLPADDSQRASLPLNEETDNDVNSIGLIIDARIVEPVIEPCPGISSADWLPTVWVLGNDGKVQGWYIFHVGDLREKSFNSEGAIKYQDVLFQEAQGANSITLEPKVTEGSQNDPEMSLSLENFSLEPKDSSAAEHKVGSQDNTTPSFGSITEEAFAPASNTSGSTQLSFGSEPTPNYLSTTKPAFGSSGFGSTTKTAFGSTTTEKPSLFGDQKTPAFGSSGFGSTTGQKTPAFGSSSFGSTTKTAFGSTTNEKPSLFGDQKTPAFGSSGFGSTTSQKTPAFGSSGFGSTTKTAFGSTTTEKPSLFGDQKTPAFGSSGFGSTTKTAFGSTTNEKPSLFGDQKTPAFGSTTNEKPSLFGDQKTPAFGSSSFGSTTKTAFGSTTTEKPSLFGDQKTPAFGSSGFGSTTKTAFGSTTNEKPSLFGDQKTPAFGSSSFGSTTKTAFGSTTTEKPSLFGDQKTPAFGSSGFGSTTKTAFGSTTNEKPSLFGDQKTPAFGSSSFGSTTKTAFGSTTTEKPSLFGDQKTPAFGSSGFGSTTKTAFGSTTTEKPSLFGDQKTPAFGSSGFGSTTGQKTPAFGSSSFGSTTKPAFGSSTFSSAQNDASSGSSSVTSPFINLSKPKASSDQPELSEFGSTSFGSTNEQKSSINSNNTAAETKSKFIYGSEQTHSAQEDIKPQDPEGQAMNETKILGTKNPANIAFSFGPSINATNVGSTTFAGGHQFGSTSFGNKPVADTTSAPFGFTASVGSGLGSSGFASFADESPFQKLKKGTSIFGGQDSAESPFATVGKKDENKAESPFKAWEKTAETNSSLSNFVKPVLNDKSPFGGLYGKKFNGTQRKSDSPSSDSGTESDDELADELRLDENEDEQLEVLEDDTTEGVISSRAPSADTEDDYLEGSESDANTKAPPAEFGKDAVNKELGIKLVKDKIEDELNDADKTTRIETYHTPSSSSKISLSTDQTLDVGLGDDKPQEEKSNEIKRKTKAEDIQPNRPFETQFGAPSKDNTAAHTSTDSSKQGLDEELAQDRAENIDIVKATQKAAEEEKFLNVSEVATELGSSDSFQGLASGDDDNRAPFMSETEDIDDDVEVIDEKSMKGFDESVSSNKVAERQKIPLSNSKDTKNVVVPLHETSNAQSAGPYITESTQTAEMINESVVIQSFENDEDYFNSFFIPPEVPPYVYLTKVSYPRLSADAGFQEIEKIYYDTQAEIDVVEENCRNLGIFLNEHLKSEPVHTAKFLNSPKHWRLSEAKSVSGIIDEQLGKISELGSKIKSDSDLVDIIKDDLKKLDKQQKYIIERLTLVGKNMESKTRQLPYDTVVLQDRLRKSSLEVSNRLRDAEESIILLKVSIDKRNASSTAIEDLIDHLNSVLVLTSDEVRKISKLKAEQEKFFQELNTTKDFEASISKIKLDDSAKRLKNRRKLVNMLRQRSSTSITDQ